MTRQIVLFANSELQRSYTHSSVLSGHRSLFPSISNCYREGRGGEGNSDAGRPSQPTLNHPMMGWRCRVLCAPAPALHIGDVLLTIFCTLVWRHQMEINRLSGRPQLACVLARSQTDDALERRSCFCCV